MLSYVGDLAVFCPKCYQLPNYLLLLPHFLELVEFKIYEVPKRFYNKNFLQQNKFWKHCTLLPTSFEIYSTLSIFNISQRSEINKLFTSKPRMSQRHWSMGHAWYIFQNLAEQFLLQTTGGGKLRKAMSTGANTTLLQQLFSLLLPLSSLRISGL